jgi:hypothetical protein
MNIQNNATAFSALQAMVLEVFKRTDKTTELKRALNDTYREMAACIDPNKLQDQIYQICNVGQEDYAIPDVVLRINHPIRLIEPGSTNNSSQSGPLTFITKDEYDELEPNPNATTIQTGKPWAYAFWKNSFLLTHIPDKAYQIEVNIGGEPTIMVSDTDATIFSPMWDETIKAGALARLYAGIQLKEETAMWMTTYRYGFLGNAEDIIGGIGLLKLLNENKTKAPIVVEPRDY